jgi:hypothetical protein
VTTSPPPPESQEPVDLRAELHGRIKDFHGYDETAVEEYLALGHYLSLRSDGMPEPQAAALVCEQHGHDAPRGLCRRCGLGVELGSESEKKQRDRVAKRDAWLAERMR